MAASAAPAGECRPQSRRPALTLSTAQPLLAQAFGVTRSFPAWFALIAACAATTSLLNARLVMRFGMARLVRGMLVVEVAFSLAMLVATVSGAVTGTAAFALTIAWITSVFFTMGLTMGNLNALALAPLGHLAGTAASVLSASGGLARIRTGRPRPAGGRAQPLHSRWMVRTAPVP